MHLSEHPVLFYLAHTPDTIPDRSLVLQVITHFVSFQVHIVPIVYIFALSFY